MPRLFGTDGIRGTVGVWPMTPEFVLQLGQAAGCVIRGEQREATLVIGRDTRQSSAMLQEALDAGLMSSGVHVIDLGVAPTPGVSWLVRHLGADAGVVISASHNPADQNGIKFFARDGRKLPEALEESIEGWLPTAAGLPLPETLPVHSQLGHTHNGEIYQEMYARSLMAEHPGLALDGVKIVVDCANGAASFIAPEVFSRMGLDVVTIHASPNGRNINVDAGSEHVRRSTEEMRLLIDHHRAKFGLAFDGDADRVVFVDQAGDLIDGDHMLGFLARYFDARGRLLGRSVVTTVMRNSGLKQRLEQDGIRMYETPVGDKYVTDQIFALKAADPRPEQVGIGGEQAGHILVVDSDHPTGDGLRTALYVMRAFIESGAATLGQFAAGVGKTPQIIASAYVGRGPRMDKAALAELEAETAAVPGIVRANLRYSGTEPRFRAMLEADASLNERDLARVAVTVCRRLQALAGVGEAEIDILNATRGGVLEVE
ncbi:MAG: phosphoglucosamine mutase [Chloroflexota bacterium]